MSLTYTNCPVESQIELLLLPQGVHLHSSSHGKMLQSCTLYKISFVNISAEDVHKLAHHTYGKF